MRAWSQLLPPLIAGKESNLQSNLPVIGVGLIGDYQFNKTKQFFGSNVCEQSVVGTVIYELDKLVKRSFEALDG